ncbi:uncharacterized protein LOC107365176 [Tetranychus urticae]|uniref:Uncharacterized protein n=1 Tax=Tetranychus urticae TaxID=32264 RepID=T1KLQ0_TETUR|nr:uncharacterized protein LOC107365176 [Tetranychus urticae]
MIKAKWWNKRKASYQGGSKPLLKKRRVVSDKPDTEVVKVNKKQFNKPEDPVDEEAEIEVQNTVEKEEEVINPVDQLLTIFEETKKEAARKKLTTELRAQKGRKTKTKRK